jgi:hypothetical protein
MDNKRPIKKTIIRYKKAKINLAECITTKRVRKKKKIKTLELGLLLKLKNKTIKLKQKISKFLPFFLSTTGYKFYGFK